MVTCGSETDWRDAAAYAPLLQADRSLLAWEWLRRDPAYRSAAEQALGRDSGSAAAHRWGLHAFELPSQAVPHARPLWRRRAHPYVLCVKARAPGTAADRFELERYLAEARLAADPGGEEHLLLCDGYRAVRLDILGGSVAAGPVELHYLLAGRSSARKPLMTLMRFLAFAGSGRFAGTLHPREARARRWVLQLRASDALTAGASQREIAGELLSTGARTPRWRTEEPSLRLQVQRLVRRARAMASGGYLDLLG